MSAAASTGLKSLTLNTPNIEAMVRFFAALGFVLVEGQVDKGTRIFTGQIGDIGLRLLTIPKVQKTPTPDLALSIQVQNISQVLERIRKLPDANIMMEVEYLNNGKTAVVLDPDGHSIELLEQN